jgi:Holliday junction resolvase RusA-like endonuclease
MDANTQTVRLPWAGKSKPRPRVTKHGTYNDPEYTEWKENVSLVMGSMMHQVDGKVRLGLTFNKDSVDLVLVETERKRFGRNDIDNLAGGIMDALQESGVIDNDSQVVYLTAQFGKDQT